MKSADGDLSARPLTRTAVRCFVRRFLCGRSVPRYMVPSGIRFQASIPVTKNGKADRRAIYGAMSHDNSAAASSDESLGESSTVDEPAGADETGYVGPCRYFPLTFFKRQKTLLLLLLLFGFLFLFIFSLVCLFLSWPLCGTPGVPVPVLLMRPFCGTDSMPNCELPPCPGPAPGSDTRPRCRGCRRW